MQLRTQCIQIFIQTIDIIDEFSILHFYYNFSSRKFKTLKFLIKTERSSLKK